MPSVPGSDDLSDAAGYDDWVPTTSPSTPPPPETIAWVERELGADVVDVEALDGGLSSAIHRLTLRDREPVVLRRYTLADWLEREPHIPHDEVRNLRLLSRMSMPFTCPAVLAADPSADHTDVPAVVMSHVDGQPELSPDDANAWADAQAEALAAIHSHPPQPGLGNYDPWYDPDRPLPIWTDQPDAWRDAIDRARRPLPDQPARFLHRDFHPNNLHWQGDRIVAVVDWLSACNGPVAGDLAHNRWNLAIVHSPELAERFTDSYRRITGYSDDVAPFDLATVLSGPVGPFPTYAWNALGRSDLTPDIVHQRIDEWLVRLLG